MQLEHLREFIAIADMGSYTKAAEKLFVTQSALTRHVAAMEDEMGVRLLDRNTHGIALTAMGKRAYKTFKGMLGRYDELMGDVAGYLDGLTGTISVGVLYYEMARFAMPVLDAFSTAYPYIEVHTESGQPRDIDRLMREGVIDVGMQASTPGFDWGDDWVYLPVAEFPYVALISEGHRLAGRHAITLDDLESEKVVSLSDDLWLSRQIEVALGKCGFSPSSIVEARHIDDVPLAVMRYGAVALVSANMRNTYPNLCAVDIANEKLCAQLGYTYLRSNDNPALTAFLHTAVEVFGVLEYQAP